MAADTLGTEGKGLRDAKQGRSHACENGDRSGTLAGAKNQENHPVPGASISIVSRLALRHHGAPATAAATAVAEADTVMVTVPLTACCDHCSLL